MEASSPLRVPSAFDSQIVLHDDEARLRGHTQETSGRTAVDTARAFKRADGAKSQSDSSLRL
jgi:hypothetical protein